MKTKRIRNDERKKKSALTKIEQLSEILYEN